MPNVTDVKQSELGQTVETLWVRKLEGRTSLVEPRGHRSNSVEDMNGRERKWRKTR